MEELSLAKNEANKDALKYIEETSTFTKHKYVTTCLQLINKNGITFNPPYKRRQHYLLNQPSRI